MLMRPLLGLKRSQTGVAHGAPQRTKRMEDTELNTISPECTKLERPQASPERALARIQVLEERQSFVEAGPLQQPMTQTIIQQSECSSNSKFYKEGWCAKEKWGSKEHF